MRTGLLLLPSRPAAELVDLAVGAERLGYDDFWLADERFFREVYTVLGLAAARTSRLRLGPGVTDPYSRHPALTAMAIATLDEVSAGLAERRAAAKPMVSDEEIEDSAADAADAASPESRD